MSKVPFIVYADSECMIRNDDYWKDKKIGEVTRDRLKFVHEPTEFQYYIKASEGIKFKPILKEFIKKNEDQTLQPNSSKH